MGKDGYGRRNFSLRVALFLSVAFLLVSVVPALASESNLDVADEAGTQAGVFGLGVGFVPDYEGSDDYEGVPLPQLKYNWANGRYLSLLGNTLRVNLIQDKKWHAGPLVRYRKERDDVDNDRVDRLEKVDAAVELGAFGSVKMDRWLFMLTAAQDVADGHDGYVIDLSGAYTIPYSERAVLFLFASTTYASADYMESYFEIDAQDSARSGLKTFNAGSGIKDVAAGAGYQYSINENWGLLGVLRYARLLGDAEDSPVVDDEGDASQWLGGVLVNYRF